MVLCAYDHCQRQLETKHGSLTEWRVAANLQQVYRFRWEAGIYEELCRRRNLYQDIVQASQSRMSPFRAVLSVEAAVPKKGYVGFPKRRGHPLAIVTFGYGVDLTEKAVVACFITLAWCCVRESKQLELTRRVCCDSCIEVLQDFFHVESSFLPLSFPARRRP